MKPEDKTELVEAIRKGGVNYGLGYMQGQAKALAEMVIEGYKPEALKEYAKKTLEVVELINVALYAES